MFLDPSVDPTVTSKSPGPGRDILAASSNNLYAGVRVSHTRDISTSATASIPVWRPRTVVWWRRSTGSAAATIARFGASSVTFATRSRLPRRRWRAALDALIRFYETGEEADRVAYDIAWVRDQDSPVDTINGFVEVYMDPRGVKGAWEGIVSYVHDAKTRDIQTLAAHAQWFEDHMPWDPRFRKPDVAGVTARAIEVVVETGDSGPITAVGINLPNDQAIRERYGSKSVSLANVSEAYERSTPAGHAGGVLLERGGGPTGREMGRRCTRARDRDARSHRPWLGKDGARRDGAASPAAGRALLFHRRSPGGSGGPVLPSGSEARRARHRRGRGSRCRSLPPSTSTTCATRWFS